MASTEYMNRQKLVVIVITGVFLALAILVVVISVIFSDSSTNVASPTPSVTETGTPTLSDADNDYSKDEGYIPLADNFDPSVSPTENTVYNDSFSYFTMNRLMCELSNKKVVTEKALEPLSSYLNDLLVNTSSYAVDARSQGVKTLEDLRKLIGEPMPEKTKSDLAFMYCNSQEVDFEKDTHDHD